jgi:DNA-cytosine methyltransferase
MRYFEMFAGVGGFGIGIQRAYENKHRHPTSTQEQEPDTGVRGGNVHADEQLLEGTPSCVGFSEIDPHASNVLRYHYPNIKNYGDCTKINWSDVPDFDLLVGGSPCQDFSIAGKRAGLVGARSGLAYEYIRCLEEKHPAHFIWENVRGVLSSNRGWDFAAILNQMAQAGYSLQWQVLNAKHFGVPQNRERVFVIGTREDGGSPGEVFFEQGANVKDIEVTGILDTPTWQKRHEQIRRIHGTDGISPTIPTGTGGGVMTKIEVGVIVNEGQMKPVETANAIDANFHKGFDNHGQRTGVYSPDDRRELLQGAEQPTPDVAHTIRTGGGQKHD